MASTYSEKLKDPRWQRKRLEVLEHANWKCELCSDEETELHVHHLEYNGEPWGVDKSKLKCLCKDCHSFIEYQIPEMITAKSVFKLKKDSGIGYLIFYSESTGVATLGTNGKLDYISFIGQSKILEKIYNHNQSIEIKELCNG